ncbi:MAG: hypothetical protein PVF84_02505 [Desulfuromonadales bacterium]|jgi:hypothetical protein
MMPVDSKSVRVAVNVMRSRLTLIGFNIAIVSFQMVFLNRLSGGMNVPGIDHNVHLGADMALFMSMALSLIAMVAFISSCALDEVGVCNHWSLVAGDLLMYLGLAHTATGFFVPLIRTLENFASRLPESAPEIAVLQGAIVVVGGVAWFATTYVGPVVSLLRSPFPPSSNRLLGGGYLVLLFGAAWIGAYSALVEAQATAGASGIIKLTLAKLVQPFWW